jgi:hypothetical protein
MKRLMSILAIVILMAIAVLSMGQTDSNAGNITLPNVYLQRGEWGHITVFADNNSSIKKLDVPPQVDQLKPEYGIILRTPVTKILGIEMDNFNDSLPGYLYFNNNSGNYRIEVQKQDAYGGPVATVYASEYTFGSKATRYLGDPQIVLNKDPYYAY